MKNAYKILVLIREGNRSLEKPWHICENNIKMGFNGRWCGGRWGLDSADYDTFEHSNELPGSINDGIFLDDLNT